MKINIKNNQKIKTIKKNISIFMLIFILVFSNFISFLPKTFQNNKIIDNFEIKKASADIEQRRPTANTDSAILTTNPQNAYDANGTTFSTTSYGANADPSITFHTWQTTTNTYTSSDLRIRYHADTGSDDTYAIAYSTTGCAGAFVDIIPPTSTGVPDTTITPIPLGASPNLSQLCIKIYTSKSKGADGSNVYIRDIWVEGTFTPPANNPPILIVNQPDGIGDTIAVGNNYNINYDLSDNEDAATVDFYYDNDAVGNNGTLIASCVGQGEGVGATCSWDTTGMTPGDYYIYGKADDSINPSVYDYSSGVITINAPASPPNATGYVNSTEGTLLDGGRSSQQITVSGTNFGTGPSDGINNAVKIGTYIVPDGNVISWNDATIIFTIPSATSTYGGIGINGLIIRANGLDDSSPQDFYVYPNITSISTNSEQIGTIITVSGDHFQTLSGSVTINSQSATVIGEWNETSLTVRTPGQEGAGNISGKIQITRNDTRISNQFPTDPTSFTILAPSVSSSNPASATTGQSSVSIEFTGLGIDTEIGTGPILKLVKSGESDIVGTGYSVITAYQTVSANFNLSSATAGAWDLVITNMDGQNGICSGCFTINAPSGPVITGINPAFGLNSGITNITSISGSNFQSGATAKLTKTAQSDIIPSTAFTFTNANTLSNGAYDLSLKPLGYWNVIVTNPDLQIGSYGNEIDTGFEIRSSMPSDPINIYQFKDNLDGAQTPTTEITVGNGIGGQLNVYFRVDMQGGLIGELYYPQVELKTIGTAFDGVFVEGTGVIYNGATVHGWVNITGIDGNSYHWRARVRNSAGNSNWVVFGGNLDPNDVDIYIDNNLPTISPGTDGTCNTSVSNITDLSATIQWNTSDTTSGAQNPPGSGSYATAQAQYIKTSDYIDWISSPGITTAESAWENSPHQINFSSLTPGTNYTFRMRSKDGVQNEGVSANCNFITEGARPIKTIEFFILQESNKNTGTKIKKNFILTVPENFGIPNSIQAKSAYIEISGISSATGNQTINAGLLRGNRTAEIGPIGNNYILDSTGTTTQFTILFNALNPGSDNEDMTDITSGGNYEYTLFLNGDGITDVSLFSGKLVITYNYQP
ncbi:MAG: IPT/TIG domain-containing protein [Patescibacteria group bacterium]|nr:IPT/TIG domain-containing protein [Patescibacteria group bacterium]